MKKNTGAKENNKTNKLYDYLLSGHFSDGHIIRAQVAAETENMAKTLFNDLPNVKELEQKAVLEQYTIVVLGEHEPILDNGRFLAGINEDNKIVVVMDMKNLVACRYVQGQFQTTNELIALSDNTEEIQDPMTYANIINGVAEYLTLYKPNLL